MGICFFKVIKLHRFGIKSIFFGKEAFCNMEPAILSFERIVEYNLSFHY